MAELRFPARCKDTSNSISTNDYTCADSTAAGYRNLTRAVVDGDLADGDYVAYMAVDTTVTGGPKLLEVGVGQWNNTTKVLSRTTIYQPAAGIVSWGVGVRDIFIIDNPHDVLRLAGGTLTGLLKVLIAGTILASPATETVAIFQRSASSNDCGVSIVSHTAGLARLNLGDTAGEKQGGLVYSNATDALTFRTNNANGPGITSAGVLTNAAGAAFVAFIGSSAVKMAFYMSAAPTGWTRVTGTGFDGAAIRLIDGAGGGTNSGASGRQNISSLTVSDVTFGTQSVQSGAGATVYDTVSNPHNHTLLIRYADFIVCGYTT